MLLSIGMIVKNEEKYLDRCLTALKPILENVDSELIIADTGSEDSTVEIAKKHTDNVYHFEWINDFSAARNSTYDKAQGEWYMFIDADEILQNCDDIIHFFNSGEYRKFGSAVYTIRSYTSEGDYGDYTDSRGMRLTKRIPEARFENAIHETFAAIIMPTKHLNMIADHYGYLFRDESGKANELAYEKSKRNLENLLKSVEEDGDNVNFNVYREISDCYVMVGDLQKALEYLNLGLEKNTHEHVAISQYYSKKAKLLMSFEDYKGVIETVDNYFDIKDNPSHTKTLATDFDMYAFRAEAYYRISEYGKSVDDFTQFFRVYNSFSRGRLNTQELLYISLVVQGDTLKAVYFIFLKACISAKRYNTAEEYIKNCRRDDFFDDTPFMTNFIDLRLQITICNHFKGLKGIVDQLDERNREIFNNRAIGFLHKFPDKEEMTNALAEIAEPSTELEAVVKIYRSYYSDGKINKTETAEFIKKYGTVSYTDILCMMISSGTDITPFITNSDFNAKEIIHSMFREYPHALDNLLNYDVSLISPDGLKAAASVYCRAMAEAVLVNIDMPLFMEKYGEVSAKWQETFPEKEIDSGIIKSGVIIHKFAEARKAKDYKLCISEMRHLASFCPEFAPYINKYKKFVQDEINAAAPKKPQNSQLAEMAAVVKKNVRAMISSGNLDAARKTLAELSSLTPNDPDIEMLLGEVEKQSDVK